MAAEEARRLDPAKRDASLPSVEGLSDEDAEKALKKGSKSAGGGKGPSKAELLAEAQEKGLDVSDSNTKAEIEDALDEAALDASES